MSMSICWVGQLSSGMLLMRLPYYAIGIIEKRPGGLLPLDAVREADTNPFNLRLGVSKPYDLHYSGDECEIVFGSNSFTTQYQGYETIMVPVSIDGTPILAFILSEGHLLLTLNLFDKYNNLVLRIHNNQLFYSISPWDIQLVGRNLIIREASREILVDILFELPNRIIINRGRFLLNGVEILITPEYALLTNNLMEFRGNSSSGCAWGLVLGNNPNVTGCIYSSRTIPRYLGDRSAAVRWVKENIGITVSPPDSA